MAVIGKAVLRYGLTKRIATVEVCRVLGSDFAIYSVFLFSVVAWELLP
jgi:hypothetical protein